MRTIVTGVQDGDTSVRVLERALAEAASSHLPLRAVNAWWRTPLLGDMAGMGYPVAQLAADDNESAAQDLAGELLAKALSAAPAGRHVAASAEGHFGDPGRVLVEQARGAQLLVVGGRGHGAVTSALLGSATGYVLHHATCPVMVVPGTTAPGPFARVVVGVDGTDCSRTALRWALDAAAGHRCPLAVVHANDVHSIAGLHTSFPEHEAIVRQWLSDEIAATLPDTRGVVVSSEAVDGTASRLLLEIAGPDDLLVVGSRGRGGFADLVLGSVAMQCTAHARGAVVVVHQGDSWQ